MGLFTEMLLLPLAPVRGVVKLGEVIQQHVEQELNNPATTRRQLEELEEKRRRGEISAEEEKKGQQAILSTKMAPRTVTEQLDKLPVAAENKAGGKSERDQRRAVAKKSIRRSSASVRRRLSASRNGRTRRSA